jgi:hypothetical protein
MTAHLLGLTVGVSLAAGFDRNVDRAVAGGRNDVVYLAPATEPYEALPLGNGRLGGMVRNQSGITWLLNHGSFFANAAQDNDLLSSGEVTLALPGDWQSSLVEQRLVLHDAALVTRYQTGRDTHTVTSWMAEGRDLLVVQVESTAPLPELPVTVSIWDRRAKSYERIGVSDEVERRVGPRATTSEAEIALSTVGAGARRATALAVRPLDGKAQSATAEGLRAAMQVASVGKKRMTLLVACPVVMGERLSLEDASRAAREVLAQAAAKGLRSLRKEHDRFWHDYWSKSGVLMHSADGLADYVENLYHLQLYWMAASSRGPEAPKFNGGSFLFCNDWRSWDGYYWYQNTRELYWSLLPANHAELFAPLIDLYWRNLPAAQKLAKDLFNAPGACYHETMGRTGDGDKANNSYTCLYHTTGTEIAHQFYQHYLHTRDEAFLREKAYPLMKEALTFHLSFLRQEADGLYHLYPSNARETYWWIKDSITDLTALRATLPILLRESERLGRDVDQRAHWADVLARAVPEMQLQSYGGVIRVFPAWPKGWESEFTLAAEGGFLVSSRISTNGEIPEVRIRSQLGGACTIVNPWSGDAVLRLKQGTRKLAQTHRFVVATKPGNEFVLTPANAAAKFEPIPVARNDAPKWPFHQGPDDTLEAYLKRTESFGMLGIAKDGQNLTRNRVQKALAGQPLQGPAGCPNPPDCHFAKTTHPDARWFAAAGLGLFVHWGIASVDGRKDLSWSMVADTPWDKGSAKLAPEQYWQLAERFNPEKYDPDQWMRAAQAAGFRYVVLTARHHDGFALWPSAYGDFNTKNYMGGRDLLKPYTADEQ